MCTKDAQSVDKVINEILHNQDLAKDGWFGNKFTFQFSTDSVGLNEDYINKINVMYKFLKNNQYKVIVIGHTDSEGSKTYNYTLSKQRAKVVRDQLIQLGIDPNRISIEGRGENEPIASNLTKEGRKSNRRVTIEVKKYY